MLLNNHLTFGRFELSVVPPLNTSTGEPDCVDAEELEWLGFTSVPGFFQHKTHGSAMWLRRHVPKVN